MVNNDSIVEQALASNAWPFQEAQMLVERYKSHKPEKGYVLFETGYGPSGLPHIGTFGEVARTSMVRRAFELLSDIPTRLIAFSDDMDGLRKVPENLPQQEMLKEHLGKPLTSIPDPFGTAESFGHHMNGRLKAFLDAFGFEYEFMSATDCYRSGFFDNTLLALLQHYDDVVNIILPTLGNERQLTYSPFMPVCPETGRVLMVQVVARDVKAGTITYLSESGKQVETPVTGGRCKVQWKCDWAMRWRALGVDYEMYGKDLIPSAELSGKICEVIGGEKPLGFFYELFLDELGQKISKSKGNGLTIDEWLTYAPQESLAYYMYQSPRKAKRLYFDVIPRSVDEYLTFLEKFPAQEAKERFANPAWHIHGGNPPKLEVPLTFNLLLNLASACNPEDKSVLWGFISRYAPGTTPENCPMLDKLAGYAVQYYRDFVMPNKSFRAPTDKERVAMQDLAANLALLDVQTPAADIQTQVYEVGKAHGFENLREWFGALYEVLLGSKEGPRMGSFIALYGLKETVDLIRRALSGEDLAKAS